MKRVVIIGVLVIVAVLILGLGIAVYPWVVPCHSDEERAAAEQYLADVTGLIGKAAREGSGAVTLPTLPDGQELILANPYGLTDGWVNKNTELSNAAAWELTEANNGLELMLLAVIEGSCLVGYFHFADQRFVVDVGSESGLLLQNETMELLLIRRDGFDDDLYMSIDIAIPTE